MITAYPYADTYSALDSIAVKPFAGFGPTGITVHYTADGDLERVKRESIASTIGYHLIFDKLGKVHQTSRLDRTVNHAGKAAWQGVSPNRAHIALSVLSWGRLNKDKTAWNGTPCPDAIERGKYFWDACTGPQEAALVAACRYLIGRFHMQKDSLCGHDECALPKGRKIDPGDVMIWNMTQLRHILWP